MGRWAEVYFTNPPDKRAEAVAELLRELERNPQPTTSPAKSPAKINDALANFHAPHQVEEESQSHSFPESELPAEGICPSCGHRSSYPQKFCGMCGMPLGVEEAAEEASHVSGHEEWQEEEPREPASHFENHSNDGHSNDRMNDRFHDRAREFEPAERQPYAAFPSLSPARETPANFSALSDYEAQSMSRSKGIYIGLAVVLILVAIGVVRWRTSGDPTKNPSSTLSSVSHPIPDSPPPLTPEPSQPAPTPTNPSASAAATEAPEATSKPESSKTANAETARPKPRPSPNAAAALSNAAATSVQSSSSGAEELATAQKYLNPSPGAQRDTGQAALWLWKAVAKQNVPATMLLSDLYLRGDGVAKSCDQAHVLLDAAARKGNAAAGERLRHLQAFGCQ
jgi:hypothetical protein